MTSLRRIASILGALMAPMAFVVPVAAAGSSEAAADGRHDFDFFYGSWRIENRKLVKPLSGTDQWETFAATSTCHPILDGMGNQDEFRTPHRPGFVGMAIRFFDPKAQTWSIFWIDNRMGVLQPPVVGKFVDGKGVFEGPDTWDDKPITVRYTWSGTRTMHPRWEQAFSVDGGKTWETNWVSDFTRVAAKAEAVQ